MIWNIQLNIKLIIVSDNLIPKYCESWAVNVTSWLNFACQKFTDKVPSSHLQHQDPQIGLHSHCRNFSTSVIFCASEDMKGVIFISLSTFFWYKWCSSPQHIWKLELQTKFREDFTITKKMAPTWAHTPGSHIRHYQDSMLNKQLNGK